MSNAIAYIDSINSLEALPKYTERVCSADGAVQMAINPIGSQVLRAEINGRSVMCPAAGLHSVLFNDPRPKGNPTPMGETKGYGGTWPSFGGGDTVKGVLTPVHGPFSAPWCRHTVEERTGDSITMHANWSDSYSKFFRPGERYSMQRMMAAVPAEGDCEGGILIQTRITSQSDRVFAMTEFAEHTYYASGKGAGVLDVDGNVIPIDSGISEPFEENSNYLDVRLDSSFTGTPGRCVFFPDGGDGHVVVIDAAVVSQGSTRVPVEQFCLYRYRQGDKWTAIEPVMSGMPLQNDESVTMDVSIRTFANLRAYRKDQSQQ